MDYKRVHITAGNGGDGNISFFRGSRNPIGPPCGGSGGKGGDVYLVATKDMTSLGSLENRYRADHGKPGETKQMHGANGKDLEIRVPVGTRVTQLDLPEALDQKKEENHSDWELIKKHYKFKSGYKPQEDRIQMLKERIMLPGARTKQSSKPIETDLLEHGQKILVARGGKGGLGNPHFVTPVIPGPAIAGRGESGTKLVLEIELKTLADVGLVGLPPPSGGCQDLAGNVRPPGDPPSRRHRHQVPQGVSAAEVHRQGVRRGHWGG